MTNKNKMQTLIAYTQEELIRRSDKAFKLLRKQENIMLNACKTEAEHKALKEIRRYKRIRNIWLVIYEAIE